MKFNHSVPLLLGLASTLLAQPAQPSNAPPQGKTQVNASAQMSQQHQDPGARIFAQNCSRCHNTPEGFSPRISGTILMHMRVRASLSQHDQEVMLRFLNP